MMITKADSRMLVLLIEAGLPDKSHVCDWLDENGFLTWRAKDLRHALEELTDFTVRQRPDVVLLEVTSLPENFEILQATIRSSSRCDDVGVVGFDGGKTSREEGQFYAHDLNHLKGVICQQLRPTPAFEVQTG